MLLCGVDVSSPHLVTLLCAARVSKDLISASALWGASQPISTPARAVINADVIPNVTSGRGRVFIGVLRSCRRCFVRIVFDEELACGRRSVCALTPV